jgi:hypothetical protein
MANNALKTNLKTDLIDLIKSMITNSNYYYLFVGRATPYEDNPSTVNVESDTNPPSIGESSRNQYDAYRNMMFAKRVRPENIRYIIPRIDWTYGNAYTAYSETTDMAGKSFYVITTDFNVYKCMGAVGASTIMPTGKSTDTITLSDGYKWKYLYTVPENDIEYITLEYIPIFVSLGEYPEQREVQNAAKPGTIDVVSVNASLSPTFSKIFATTRLMTNIYRPIISSELGITVNSAGSTYISFSPVGEDGDPSTGFWNNYAIYVSGGSGVGQYFRILNFVKGGSGITYYYASVYPAVDRDLDETSVFKIVPNVVVDGDGSEAVVVPQTSSDKKISSLSIVNGGKNYSYAKPRVTTESGSALIGSQVSLFNDSITTSLSTPKGHGYNAVKELGSSDIMIVVEIEGTQNDKITVRNQYRQFGLVKNPFLQGGLTLAGSDLENIYEVLIRKQPNKDQPYNTDTFVTGNYIFGKETRATAKIVDWQTTPGSKFHKLIITNLVGNFRLSDEASDSVRVHYASGFSAPFATGDTVNQYSNTIGLTLSATGTITSHDYYDRSLVIDTTLGSFVSGKTMTFSGGYTLSGANIVDVDEVFGEYIGQLDFGSTSGSEFLTFSGDEIFGRIASTVFSPRLTTDFGEYDLTTKLTLVDSSSSFIDGILNSQSALDGTISQIDSITLKKVTGDIIDFTVAGGVGFTGIASLSNVKGVFNSTDALKFTPYGSTAEVSLTTVSINTIQQPELKIGSGDLLYIENIRPIERNLEQMEQFKIVIGF